LDRINKRFLESEETKKHLDVIEKGLLKLKYDTKQYIIPMSEFL